MYRTAIEHARSTPIEAETLYEACKRIAGVRGGLVLHIVRPTPHRRPGLVAFWCAHENVVKAGYMASHDEREAITDYDIR